MTTEIWNIADFQNAVSLCDGCLKQQTEALAQIAKPLMERNEIAKKKVAVFEKLLDHFTQK